MIINLKESIKNFNVGRNNVKNKIINIENSEI